MEKYLLSTYRIRLLLLLFNLLFLLSVTNAQKKENSALNKNRGNVDISDVELTLRLTDYFIRFAEDVEKTADKIFYSSSDPEIKRAALMWKIYGISAMGKTINMPDPIAGFYNAWPLSKQMIYFFESGNGREVLGAEADLAFLLSKQYETKLDSIIIDMTNLDNHIRAESQIEKWALDHPIEDFYFTRESTMDIFAKWIGKENLGIGKSVATMTEEVVELSNKIDLYADMIPRQARWQVDYVMLNYLHDSTFTSSLDLMLSSMEQITNVIKMTPEIIEYNREATLRDIDVQREKSLKILIEERKAVIEEIKKERIEVISSIINERMVVLDEIKKERSIVLEEVKGIYDKTVKQAGAEAERLLNIVFWRLTLISIILGVTILLAVILYKKL